MGQNGSFKILGRSAKEGTCSDGVDLTRITFTNVFDDETTTNDRYQSNVQNHFSSLEKSHISSTQRERPTSPSPSHKPNVKERSNKEDYQKKIERVESEVQELREEKETLMARTNTLTCQPQLVKDYHERIKLLEAEVQILKEEKKQLFTRLCTIGAVKLTDNNPHMADLSDSNRPDKLVEKISELYDNEWTDAFEYLTDTEGLQDQDTMKRLLDILHTIYELCSETTKKHADDLKSAILSYLGLPEERKDDFIIKEVLKELSESRATTFEATVSRIIKDAKHRLIDLLEGRDCDILDTYIQKCTYLCWFMCIKNPQMYLDFDERQTNGLRCEDANNFPLHFDTTKFVSFTQAGMYVEYVVWPAVYLYKNGPIVKKGIAQGFNREPEAIESNVQNRKVSSSENGDTINVYDNPGYAEDSPNDGITNKHDDGVANSDPLCIDHREQETVIDNGRNVNFSFLKQHDELADAVQICNGDGFNNIIHNSEEEHNNHDPLCADNLGDHSVTKTSQNLNSSFQNVFVSDEHNYGNNINIEENICVGLKEQTTELQPSENRTGLYKKNGKKKQTC